MSRAKGVRRSWVPRLFCPALLFGSVTVWAAVHRVPAEYATIQQALNACARLDTVRVAPGLYSEALHFPGVDIRLFGEYVFTGDTSAISRTIIDASAYAAEDTAAVLTFVGGNSPATEVAGFLLRGGSGTVLFSDSALKYGGAVFAYMSSPTVRWNIFSGDSANGILYTSVASPVIEHNIFCNNYCIGGVLCGFFDTTAPTLPLVFEWNEILQNDPDNVGVVASGVRGTFRYNWFHDFEYERCNPVMMTNCYLNQMEFCGNVFERISSGDVGVPFVAFDETVSLIQDNVWRDCLLGSDFALVLARGDGRHVQQICRNLFSNLTNPNGLFQGPGAGIFIQSACGVTVRDNTFENCLGGFQGMLFASEDAALGFDLTITRNRFIHNRTHDGRGAAAVMLSTSQYCNSAHPCLMAENWFEGNGPVAVAQDFTGHQWDAAGNYWGAPSGPYHPIENPGGQGDTVDASIHVQPWLSEPPNLSSQHGDTNHSIPQSWLLDPVFPNPFNSTLTIRVTASVSSPVSLRIYDLNGRLVRDLWRGLATPTGVTSVAWDGRGDTAPLPSGVYFVVATQHGGTASQTRKAVLLR